MTFYVLVLTIEMTRIVIASPASTLCIFVESSSGERATGEDRMMVKLMAVVEKLQQELFDVEKSRKEAEACVFSAALKRPGITTPPIVRPDSSLV